MVYFAGIESQKDRDLNRAIPGLRDVLQKLDDPAPIGVAFLLGPDDSDRTLWKWNIDGMRVEGRFVSRMREFVSA